MSLLGEEVVEEWLNRSGYFTIRGIKTGNSQMDILAIKPLPRGKHDCRHIECQLSIRPVSYITIHNAKKLDDAELMPHVSGWLHNKHNKFDKPKMVDLRQRLCPGKWTKELVLGNVKHEQEINLFKKHGIGVHRLTDILLEMAKGNTVVQSATGADLFDLMRIQSCWQS